MAAYKSHQNKGHPCDHLYSKAEVSFKAYLRKLRNTEEAYRTPWQEAEGTETPSSWLISSPHIEVALTQK